MDSGTTHAGTTHAGTTHAGTAASEDTGLPCIIPCPDCELPAEVTERFTLGSTDGPVEHVALRCVGGHFFKLALDRLAGYASQPVAACRFRSGD